MKLKLIVCLQFIAACAAAQAVIKGKVLDERTDQPLPYASVYINYTTIGTNSDDNGAFVLNVTPGVHDLVVSFIGHRPYQAKVALTEGEVLDLTIRLPLLPMQEIQIKAKRDAKWDKQVERFTKLFLGSGPNSKLCKILNPWVLTFPETANGIFTAQASDAIEVENLSLGYRLSYELKNFAVTNENYLVAGYVRFQELQSNDSILAKKWTGKRKGAYEGSIRHLFKSIIEQCVDEEEYELYEDRSNLSKVIRNSNFLSNVDKTIFSYSVRGKVMPGPRPHIYNVVLPSRLEVHYRGRNVNATVYPDVPFPISWIEVKGPIVVTEDGLALNPLKMTVLGVMFESRVSDLLPNNYQPEHKVSTYQNPLERKPLSKLTYLTEKPYLQTDRSYYYSEEVVWIKGYMNYYSRLVKDSLSHVLHVDLVDKTGNVVLDRRFPINDNTIEGDFSLPSYIESGDYTLRAYTRWMLNFDPTYSFIKPIRVLKRDEVAKTKAYQPDESNNTLNISTEKNQYEPREKITVTIDARDDFDKNIPANLSVSVTDLGQAVPAINETTIANNFEIPIIQLPDTLDKRTRYLIEHGFDVKGRFVAKKQKQSSGLLRFVQEQADLEFVIATEEDGSFYAPNFLLYDTAKLSVVGQTLRGKPGTVVFDSMKLIPKNITAEPLQIETYISERPVRPYIPDFSTVRILEEVTITGERIEKKKASQVLADFEVSGDWIRESRAADVLSALQMKVPGFRVMIKTDPSGFPVKYLLLGGVSSFGNTKSQEPLVLIDNVVVNDMAGGPAAQIETLNTNEIESVEISKFGGTAAYGARGGNGIISIHTGRSARESATAPGAYDKSLLQPLPVKGFSATRKFISPDYSTPEKSIAVPDNRSTIYWNPSIQMTATAAVVSFFAADNTTQYRIVVEGVTTDGKPIRGEKIVTVGKLP